MDQMGWPYDSMVCFLYNFSKKGGLFFHLGVQKSLKHTVFDQHTVDDKGEGLGDPGGF